MLLVQLGTVQGELMRRILDFCCDNPEHDQCDVLVMVLQDTVVEEVDNRDVLQGILAIAKRTHEVLIHLTVRLHERLTSRNEIEGDFADFCGV
jgi:hypothetical protein